MSKEPFEYGGYHFIPERQLKGAEAGSMQSQRNFAKIVNLVFARKGTFTRANFLIHTKPL